MKRRLEQKGTTVYVIRYLSANGMIPSLRMGKVRPETEVVNMPRGGVDRTSEIAETGFFTNINRNTGRKRYCRHDALPAAVFLPFLRAKRVRGPAWRAVRYP